MGSFKVFNRGSKKKEKEKEKKVPGTHQKLYESYDIVHILPIEKYREKRCSFPSLKPWLAPERFRRNLPKINENISEQQIRGVKIRMECRGTEDIQKESLYLEISDTGKVQASHDGNSDQTVMVLVPVGMAFNMHWTYSNYHMFIKDCFNDVMLSYVH